MCTPDGLVTSQITGAIGSAYSGYANAKAKQYSLRGQARVADVNAQLADMDANLALEQGKRQKQRLQIEGAGLRAKQITSYAGAGVDLSSDTVSRVLASSEFLQKLDENTISAEAARTAWGYRAESLGYKNRANLSRASADAISPLTVAGGSLLTSASNVSSSIYTFGKAGAFKKGGLYDRVYEKYYKR